MAKPKVSSDWLAGCAGCHMSFLDMDERIVDVINLVDLRSTPITDLKHPDESGVDVGILEGGINNSANEEVALFVCAHTARFWWLLAIAQYLAASLPCVTSSPSKNRLRRAYIETESTDESGHIPNDPELCVPTKVHALQDCCQSGCIRCRVARQMR